jgi:hypothetical protein
MYLDVYDTSTIKYIYIYTELKKWVVFFTILSLYLNIWSILSVSRQRVSRKNGQQARAFINIY